MTDVDSSASCVSARPATLDVEVTVTRDGTSPHLRVHLGGELDISTVGLLADAVGELSGTRPELVEIDLSELRFVDARGLRAFVDIDGDLRATGSRIVLTNPTPHIARILTLTAVDTEITVRSDGSGHACVHTPPLG
ncbi:STAS domain-containing protein [Pseudonocardia xinjiangensis]|uniref:STAS domain-containing protein n=1 Tax=Pseudonocardia xinjiangensis TaxID=75289 RepID=UPI003D93DD3E